MSGEKTEQPTPKRLKDARKKGQVSKSNDLTQAFLLLTAAGVLSLGGASYVSELQKLMLDFFRPEILSGNLTQEEMLHRMGYGSIRFLLLAAPLMGSLFLVSVAVNFLQVKSLFAPEVLKPKLERLNPLKGFQNIFFKPRTYLELLKNLIKLAIIGLVVFQTLKHAMRDVILSARLSLVQTAGLTSHLMFGLLFKIGALFLVIGAADFLLQKKLYLKSLKMSKYEVEKEYKEEEGDPHVKYRRKQLHEELLATSMVENVPKADVVVVNPTHLAVAVQYDEQTMNAPEITAKGQNTMAERIVELARENHVPIMRNIGLAWSLFEIENGREIPEELYQAVAEVLNWVYQLTEKQRRQ